MSLFSNLESSVPGHRCDIRSSCEKCSISSQRTSFLSVIHLPMLVLICSANAFSGLAEGSVCVCMCGGGGGVEI